MKTILVEPAVLENSASSIESLNDQYKGAYERLYQSVEMLSSAWQGSDNTAFVNQINGYKEDFQRISLLLNQYSEFLQSSAHAYRQTQMELAQQAARLTN